MKSDSARGRRIRDAIKRSPLTLGQIAAKTDKTEQTIDRWQNGDYICEGDLQTIAELLEVSVPYLKDGHVRLINEKEILHQTIQAIEEKLASLDTEMNPKAKARLITAFYYNFLSIGEVDHDLINTLENLTKRGANK